MFEAIQSGWDKLALNAQKVINDAAQIYTNQEVRDWSDEVLELELSGERTVKMTVAQAMSVYCLAKRQQGLGHLLGGGIVQIVGDLADIQPLCHRLKQDTEDGAVGPLGIPPRNGGGRIAAGVGIVVIAGEQNGVKLTLNFVQKPHDLLQLAGVVHRLDKQLLKIDHGADSANRMQSSHNSDFHGAPSPFYRNIYASE